MYKEFDIVRSGHFCNIFLKKIGRGVRRSKAVWNFSENSSFYVEQGFPYQASIWVKDEEGAEDDAEEEVDQVDVGGGAPDVDQHLYDDKCKLIKLSPRRRPLVTLTLARE